MQNTAAPKAIKSRKNKCIAGALCSYSSDKTVTVTHNTLTLAGNSERSQTPGVCWVSPSQPKLICMLEVVQVLALLGGFWGGFHAFKS